LSLDKEETKMGGKVNKQGQANGPYLGGFIGGPDRGPNGPYKPGMPPQRPQQPLNSYSSIGGLDPNVMQNLQNRFPGIQLPGMPPQMPNPGMPPQGGGGGLFGQAKGPDRAGPQMPPQMPNPGMQGMNPGQIMQMLQMQNSQQPRAGLGAILGATSGAAPTGYNPGYK